MFCIPIIAENTEDAIERIAGAATLADVMEIRLDLMEAFDLPSIIRASGKPILVTYRSVMEGGKGEADPEISAGYIMAAIQAGAEFVDIELSMPSEWREKIIDARGGSEIVVSSHTVDSTPSRQELDRVFNDSVATGADVVKIVTRAQEWDDNLRVLELIPMARARGVKIIAFCMGPMGRISRLFAHLMGAHLTFASIETGQESAAGQIPITEMKEMLQQFEL